MNIQRVEDALRGRPADVVSADASVTWACRALARAPGGAVAVVHEYRLVGLLAEEDLGQRIVVDGLDVDGARVSQVMAPRPPAVPARARLDATLAMMHRRGLRHVAVIAQGSVCGLISLCRGSDVTTTHGAGL